MHRSKAIRVLGAMREPRAVNGSSGPVWKVIGREDLCEDSGMQVLNYGASDESLQCEPRLQRSMGRT